jgi:hypothetical protein
MLFFWPALGQPPRPFQQLRRDLSTITPASEGHVASGPSGAAEMFDLCYPSRKLTEKGYF